MAKRESITAARLREILHYDPETGIFTWRVRTSNRANVGATAGCICANGYPQTSIDGHRYSMHRLAWLYVTGEWPGAETDHRNGDKTDNRFCNLRPATKAENGRNRAIYKSNTSGFKGVTWDASSRKWK